MLFYRFFQVSGSACQLGGGVTLLDHVQFIIFHFIMYLSCLFYHVIYIYVRHHRLVASSVPRFVCLSSFQVTVPPGLPFGFIQVAKLENQVFRFFSGCETWKPVLLRILRLGLVAQFSGFKKNPETCQLNKRAHNFLRAQNASPTSSLYASTPASSLFKSEH